MTRDDIRERLQNCVLPSAEEFATLIEEGNRLAAESQRRFRSVRTPMRRDLDLVLRNR